MRRLAWILLVAHVVSTIILWAAPIQNRLESIEEETRAMLAVSDCSSFQVKDFGDVLDFFQKWKTYYVTKEGTTSCETHNTCKIKVESWNS